MLPFLVIVSFFSFGSSSLVDSQDKETIGRMHTDIISHEFCYSCLGEKNQERKQSLTDLDSYVELGNKPTDSLPASFTICSSVMTTQGTDHYLMFFGLLGEDGNQWLSAALLVLENDTHNIVAKTFINHENLCKLIQTL